MKLSKLFNNPTNEYRIAPFYFLNHDLKEEELLRQINEMSEKGIGGMVLHARHGLETPYMEEPWLKAIEFIISECKKRKMIVWLYDEDNWPSGTHGGELTKNNPSYRMRHLRIEQVNITNKINNIRLESNDSLIAAFACNVNLDTQKVKEYTRIKQEDLESFSSIDSPYNKIILCYERVIDEKITFNDGYYLDTMNKDAVGEFIRLAYLPYERFTKYFGNTVKGIFTDEPSIMGHEGFFGNKALNTNIEDVNAILPGDILPWTNDFDKHFRKHRDYLITDYLVALLFDIGEKTNKIRDDYYQVITTLYKSNYHEQIAKWCHDRNLQYIGHTTEDPLWGQVRTQGNQTKVLSTFDCPGYDYLTAGIGSKENPHRIIAAKCASSISIVNNNNRVLCECFGGAGHENTIESRMIDANFMAILGTNLFIPHAFYYSFAGYRKTDWPSTDFYHAPFWEYYKEFADYLARLSVISSLPNHIVSIAILSPITTIYNEIFDKGKGNMKLESDMLFSFVSDRLLRYQRDYHYLDESQFHEYYLKDSKLFLNQKNIGYNTIILPGCKIIYEETKDLLIEFLNNNGKIIMLSNIPKVFGKDEKYNSELYIFLIEHKNVFLIKNDNDLESNFINTIISETKAQLMVTENEQLSEGIVCSKRTHENMTIYEIMNISDDDKTIKMTFSSSDLYNWNLRSGVIEKIDEVNDCSIVKTFIKGTLIVISEGMDEAVQLESNYIEQNHMSIETIKKIDINETDFTFSIKDENVLPLTKWQVELDGIGINKSEKPKVGQINIWKTSFIINDIPNTLKLILDTVKQRIPAHHGFLGKKRSMEIYINKHKLEVMKSSTWQDIYYLEKDILPYVKKGENELHVETISLLEPMHEFNYPGYVIGDFSLDNLQISKKTTHLNTYWTEEGYPYYSGIGVYSTSFILNKKSNREKYILVIEQIKDGAKVIINQQEMPILLMKPYQIDVSQQIMEGNNQLIISVFNSLDNLYNRRKKESGLNGKVYIEISTY